MNKPNDRELVEQQTRALCEAGDPGSAATVLMENYGPEGFRFLLSRLRDGEDAREVFSQFTEDLRTQRAITHTRIWRKRSTTSWRS